MYLQNSDSKIKIPIMSLTHHNHKEIPDTF